MRIEIKDLTHVYSPDSPFENRALDGVNLHIETGEFIGIIGHTGSGKSTLIAYMNALEKAEPGHVFLDGRDPAEKGTDLAAVRRDVGLVFQYPEYQLFDETVALDVAFGPRNLKLSREEIDARVDEALTLVGFDLQRKDESPFELSGGQKRRVAIAGVLAMRPKVLILDEPAAGLDPTSRREMLETIDAIHKTGVTVVMVSHSMDDVGRYCDRLYVLDHGRIAFEGTPREVFEHGDELNAIGLDVPAGAKLAARLRAKGIDLPRGLYGTDEIADALTGTFGKGGGAK